uniref:Golgi associated, gamma adaptin ear containing, ARF binding protein 3a n=1 Tax=Tetraodon nigroviridis TaxID=99883 RepID=H3CIU9_TETNG
MADDGASLESWLNKATNPSNRQEDWEYIMGFCDQVKKELEGPQISVKLLVHKIQSPQEWEALQALTVLEACMRNCGRGFHNEVGKFRFLNELVKVISPKYLGDKVSERVKTKVITMLYSWTVSLPDEAKISEAYHMLKLQGVVLADPEIPLDATLPPLPSSRPINPVFNEKKSKKLAELLKSKKPKDLQEANQLIKNMVKENEVRIQKSTKQKDTLEAVKNSVRLLNEMLAHFSPQGSSDGDKELLKELYDNCHKLKQTVIELATESEDNDSSLGDILQASDDLSHAVNSYKEIVDGWMIGGEMERPGQKQAAVRRGTLCLQSRASVCRSILMMPEWANCTQDSEILIDLVDVDVHSSSEPQHQTPASADLWGGPSAPSADEELLSLGKVYVFSAAQTVAQKYGSTNPASLVTQPMSTRAIILPRHRALAAPNQDVALFDIFSSSVPASSSSPSLFPDVLSAARVSSTPTSTPATTFSGPGSSTPPVLTQFAPSHSHTSSPQCRPPRSRLASLLCQRSSSASISLTRDTQVVATAPPAESLAGSPALLHPTAAILPLTQPTPIGEQAGSLSDVFVPLSAIKPSQSCPVTVCDAHGIRFLLHVATDCPPGRPDVLVMLASILSTAPLPARDVVLQAAVPKTMKVRLQQPSGRELAPFNPISPPAAITQVLLLANPLKGKVRLRYKLMFTLGSQPYTEVGEVNDFPTADTLGAL